ncbi:MAG: nucleotidyltransferase domain-containing protein [Candidatus Cloacimonetes bacterium]|nr:nucleotidyltransferase domain-containing protein [Candidatus Cloacimonadota bacterium]
MNNSIINDIRDTIKPIAIQYNLSTVWIFGSYSKQTQNLDSDIDLIVKTEDVIEGFKLIEVKYAFEEALNRKVDLITTNSIKGSLLENENLGQFVIYEKK